MEKQLNYNGDFSKITTIEETKRQVIINALCFTNTTNGAAYEVGIPIRTLYSFLAKEKIDNNLIKVMRIRFKESGKKIKLRFNN